VIVFERVALKASDGVLVVDDMSFELAPELTTVFLGTPRVTRQAVLQLAMKLQVPTTGTVSVAGADLRKVDGAKFRRSVGWLSGPPRLFPHRTASENVAVAARLSGMDHAEAVAVASSMLQLVEVENTWRRPSHLTAAERVRVGLARAFVHHPALVVLDDPFAGLDPVERPRLRDLLAQLRADGPTTVMLGTGDVEDAMALGHQVVLLLNGMLVQSGSPADILTRPAPGAEVLLGSALGLRGLGFVTVGDVPTNADAVVPVTASAAEAKRSAKRAPSGWVLVVDDDRRPIGWADTARLPDQGPVTGIPLVAVRDVVSASDTMQRVLDCIVSSPSQLVPKLDEDGRVVGLFSQVILTQQLGKSRS
jgi:ABC-type proline/glycine betaine transport system ATPase subunit